MFSLIVHYTVPDMPQHSVTFEARLENLLDKTSHSGRFSSDHKESTMMLEFLYTDKIEAEKAFEVTRNYVARERLLRYRNATIEIR